ncbi:MAG: DUF4340 domain-containing protein [Bacteriovoracia bacterium]
MPKKMNWTGQLIGAAVLLVGGGAIYWYEYNYLPKQESAKEEVETGGKKLIDLKGVTLKNVRLTDGSKVVNFACLPGEDCKVGETNNWEVTSSLNDRKFRADRTSISSMLSVLNNTTASETIDLSTDTPETQARLLKEYGLDEATRKQPGMRRYEFTTADGKVHTGYLGAMYPIGGKVYGLRADPEGKVNLKQILLLPSSLGANFDQKLGHWRDKKILDWAPHDVVSFQLQGSHGKISGEKQDGKWKLKTSAGELPGDIESIDGLMAVVAHINAKEFFAEKKNSIPGKKAVEITVTRRREKAANQLESEQRTLSFYEDRKDPKAPKAYAVVDNSEVVYELEPAMKDRLDKDAKSLRLSKLITSIEKLDVSGLDFEIPGQATPFSVDKKDGKWSAKENPQAELDAGKLNGLVEKLAGNRVIEFLPTAPAAVAPGLASGKGLAVTIRMNGGSRRYFFVQTDKELFAKADATPPAPPMKETLKLDPMLKTALPWSGAGLAFFKKSAETAKPAAPSLPPGHPQVPGHGGGSHDGHGH